MLPALLLLLGGCASAGHNNNWAVLVDTSRYWFNYRHAANALTFYHLVKQQGIPDNQIILMLADDAACNARNVKPATVYNDDGQQVNVYGEDVEVDFRGHEVTVENFIRLLTNRWAEDVPKSKRLETNDRSNILIYMTGHGGDNFLKFQDTEEINAHDLADSIAQMSEMKRYNEIFLIVDTCQAATMYEQIRSPNVLAAASSVRGESSYSHSVDDELGVAVIDRFTNLVMEFFENAEPSARLGDLFASWDAGKLGSTPGLLTKLMLRDPYSIPIADFFGNVQPVEYSARSGAASSEAVSLAELSRQSPGREPPFAPPRRHYSLKEKLVLGWEFYARLALLPLLVLGLCNF